MKKHFKKALSLLLTMAMILSCLSCLSVFTTSAATIDDALAAATNYVKTNKNLSTKEGLLAAVQQAVPGAAIPDGDYFYIKHAVPGVKDNTTDYPLCIPGSDGAVAAIFEVGGESYGFSCAFAHEEEVIEITETAVVGTSNGFTYASAGGDVTGYTGTADKIVIPADYSGSIAQLSDLTNVQQVKVLIINNKVSLRNNAFKNWKGLIAVQMAENTMDTAWTVFTNPNDIAAQFQGCSDLKYFKFPDWINTTSWANAPFPGYLFDGCAKLENVQIPQVYKISGSTDDSKVAMINYATFTKNNVREYIFPAKYADTNGWLQGFGGTGGTRNVHWYKDPMTFVRAAALVAAKVNECATVDEIKGALSAVKGSADAETFKESLTYTVSDNAVANDYGISGTAEISDGYDIIPINFTSGKALANLQSNYAFSPAFDPMVNAYTSISVPQCVTSLDITATPAEGAVVGTITGNTDLQVGENTVTIPVTTTDGKLVNYTISVTRLGDIPDAVKNAADAYVLANKNTVTAEGLLSAVRTVLPSISLNASDFYIKHAVPGVKDNTIDYPLNIAGSDGAVAAVFSYDGQSYGYSCAFSHEEEVIEITETAVVGTSNGFTYDGSGNVTAYTGTADKIVFPSGYSGTMKKLSDLSSANNVKVLIYDNSTALLTSAFANWDGLIAVQMNGTGTLNLGSAVNSKRETSMFANCDELKYFKFPDNVSNSYYWGSMFPESFLAGCAKLETLIMPIEAKSGEFNDYGYHPFYGTAVRDFDIPHCNRDAIISLDTEAFGGSTAVGGTRNINFYRNPMTFVRAAALVAAKVNEIKDSVAADNLMAEALTAIKGSADAESYRQGISFLTSKPFTNTVFAAEGEALITDGAKFIPIGISKVKALTSLSVGYALNPQFSISCNQYTVTVPNVVTSVTVDAVPVEGATVKSISGNTNLQVGNNTVTVTVENTDGETVTYTITVIRKGVLNAEAAAAAKLYVDEAGNEATAEGLLAAVNTVLSNATLSDFFIKHAVPGATDNDTASGYPLNIPGSDGAVSAIITYNGVNYGFEASFGHEDEVITVDSFAIAGDPDYADYFEYDANNNIVNILKPVEKIILPEGYTGTVRYYTPVYNAQGQQQTPQCLFNNDSIINADRVKVVIINNQVALQNKAFYNWNGLKAVQFSDVQCKLFTEYNSLMQQFENCDALKYVKLPSTITSGWGNHLAGLAFKDCTKLENINIPEFTASKTMSPETFYCTNIRDFFLTKNITKSGDDNNVFRTLATGTVNRIYYTDDMTLARAAALIGSALYNANATTEADIKAIAKAAITGSHDSQQFADNTVFVWEENNSTNYMLNGILTVSNNGDDISIPVSTAKALYSLSVDGYKLSEKFDPKVTSYSVKLPYDASSLTVNAVLANGASVVTVDDDISDNQASVTIVNTDGNNVTYSITVERKAEATNAAVDYTRNALLGIDGCAEVDVNKDGSFDVLDFITLKLRLENAAEAPALDSSEIMFVTAEENGIKSEDLISTVGYVSEDGTVTDTMFSAVAFNISNSITHIYEADPQNPNKTVPRIRPMTKRDWSEMIHDYVFSDGYNVDALDKAVGEVADTLGLDGYKVKVYLPLLYPSTEATNWGTLNGQQIDLSVTADRIAAQKWMIDEYIAEFNKHNYKNIVLAGFYRAQESYRDGDDAFIPAVNAYISSMNLESIWVPYREAPGYNNATVLGYFDRVNMQLNYFPGRDDLPNASTKIEIVQQAIDMALENNMDGIQLELAAQGKEQIAGLKEYMKAGVTNGLMNKENSWWIWKDSETVNYLCDSDDAYIRSTYDEMYKFVKDTLTVAEINTNPGE